jgi:molybdate transport system permease protein
MKRPKDVLARGALAVPAVFLGGLMVLPFVALIADGGFLAIARGLECKLTWPALRLSLWTTSIATLVIVLGGTPLAWMLSRSRSRLARAFETFLQLPMVIPPAVGGIALLLTFGPQGMLGAWLAPLGFNPRFSSVAVIMAQVFVSAPLYIQSAVVAFARVLSPQPVSLRAALPLARPWLLNGAAMSWARALGEFGATLMFAGNIGGLTQTLPLAIYVALGLDLRTAQGLSLLLVLVAFALLMLLRLVNRLPKTSKSH